MIDPLSVAGLVIAVGQVIAAISKYPKELKNAKSDISSILSELLCLQGILVQIQNQLRSQHDAFKILSRLPEYESILSSCHNELTALLGKLQPNRGSFKAKVQLPLWPFSKDQFNERINRLERVKSGLTLIMLSISNDTINQFSSDLQSIVHFLQGEQKVRQRRFEDDFRDRILNKLAPGDPSREYTRCLKLAHPNTGTWFLNGPFQTWSKSQNSAKTLLLRGKSGAGKSVLFSSAVARLTSSEDQSSEIISAMHYCAFDDLTSQDVSSVLSSLIAQLLSKSDKVWKQYQETLSGQIPDTVADLSALLSGCCEHFSKVYLCVDALNESREAPKIFKVLTNIARATDNILLLLTTTSLDGIRESEHPTEAKIVEFDAHGQREDIAAYVSARIKSSYTLATTDKNFHNDIHSRLLAESDGSFRFVQCHCDHLVAQRTAKAARKALQETPHGLNQTYTSMLTRISKKDPDDRPIAREALMWLSMMPLTLEQLCEVLAIEEGIPKIDDENRLEPPEVILSICKDLVDCDFDTQRVRLAHSSVQAFLLSSDDASADVTYFGFSRAELMNMVLRKSLTYLLLDDFKNGFPQSSAEITFLFRRYVFLSKAVQWPNIVKLLDEASLPTGAAEMELVMSLFDTRKMPKRGNFGMFLAAIYPDLWIEAEAYITAYQTTSPLYVAASSGMNSIVIHLLNLGNVDIESKGGRFESAPLQVAVFHGHCRTVEVLLDAGADPDSTNCGGEPCIAFARWRRCTRCVSRLLEAGAEDKDGHYRAWLDRTEKTPNAPENSEMYALQVLGDHIRTFTVSTQNLPEVWSKHSPRF